MCLSVNPLPPLSQLTAFREGVETFLGCTIPADQFFPKGTDATVILAATEAMTTIIGSTTSDNAEVASLVTTSSSTSSSSSSTSSSTSSSSTTATTANSGTSTTISGPRFAPLTVRYPDYVVTDPRLLDTFCRLVSKLADTDLVGAADAPLWSPASICALIGILRHKSADLRLQALLAIGNLLAGSDLQTDQIMSQGFLRAVQPLVYDLSLAVRKEAMWSISNITAGSSTQIQAILDANLLPAAVAALANPTERQV
jgi:hypothetical protein